MRRIVSTIALAQPVSFLPSFRILFTFVRRSIGVRSVIGRGDESMRRHGLIAGIGALILSACVSGAMRVGTSPAPALRSARFPTTTGMALPATAPGAWITLSPQAGLPGTVVRISGFLPGGPSAAQAQKTISFNYGYVCWAACPGGLTYGGVPVQWSRTQAGHFTMQFTVPRAPWLGADGPHPLAPRTYTVGVRRLPSGRAVRAGAHHHAAREEGDSAGRADQPGSHPLPRHGHPILGGAGPGAPTLDAVERRHVHRSGAGG